MIGIEIVQLLVSKLAAIFIPNVVFYVSDSLSGSFTPTHSVRKHKQQLPLYFITLATAPTVVLTGLGMCSISHPTGGGGGNGSRQWGGALGLLVLLSVWSLCRALVQVIPLGAGSDQAGRYEVRLRCHNEITFWGRVDLALTDQHAQRVVQDLRCRRGNTWTNQREERLRGQSGKRETDR